VINSVTATAFSTRMFAGATSFIASVVAAGDVDGAVLEAATDAVETITPLRYTKERLSADLSAEDLAVRMRGDLILLAEQLQPKGPTPSSRRPDGSQASVADHPEHSSRSSLAERSTSTRLGPRRSPAPGHGGSRSKTRPGALSASTVERECASRSPASSSRAKATVSTRPDPSRHGPGDV
jgi:hypothetical protein